MKKLKMGTPAMGIIIGAALTAAGVLVMLIGFWKVLILTALFGVGYFIGMIERPAEYIRDKANRIIPEKNIRPINLKDEIAREQAEIAANMTDTRKESNADDEE